MSDEGPWGGQGREYPAEIFTWGLLDGRYRMNGLLNPLPESIYERVNDVLTRLPDPSP